VDNGVPDSLPPDDEREAWIRRNAKELQQAFANPELRAQVVRLLNGSDDEH
jgi:hypothetical protein